MAPMITRRESACSGLRWYDHARVKREGISVDLLVIISRLLVRRYTLKLPIGLMNCRSDFAFASVTVKLIADSAETMLGDAEGSRRNKIARVWKVLKYCFRIVALRHSSITDCSIGRSRPEFGQLFDRMRRSCIWSRDRNAVKRFAAYVR